MKKLTISTKSNQQVVNIDDQINNAIRDTGIMNGVAHIFITHTTAALTTADLDPGTDQDMLDAFREMIPDLDYRHPHNPDHTPDHILATLIGPSVTVPVQDGKLVLGTWQHVVLFEFDGPRDRTVIITATSDE